MISMKQSQKEMMLNVIQQFEREAKIAKALGNEINKPNLCEIFINDWKKNENNQNKEEQEEKKSNLENLSDEDFDLMLEEMLKARKERKRKREK